MELKKHRRLSYRERVVIQSLLEEKKNKSFIAIKLGRTRSTITREVNKWVTKPIENYNADIAHWNAKDDYPNDPVMTISYEAIYQHIYSNPQAILNLKLIKLLTRGTSRRKPRLHPKRKGSKIIGQTSIDLRPKHIEDRLETGHWEGDLMVGANHKSVIGTIVERKSRYTLIVKLEGKKAKNVSTEFSKTLNQLEPILIKTMTYHNGIEMAANKRITSKTGMVIYFAHLYSSWERGTNENTNGLIRRYLPKGTNFNNIDTKQLQIIQDKLNNGPRKILGYKTPLEMMNLERKNLYLNT